MQNIYCVRLCVCVGGGGGWRIYHIWLCSFSYIWFCFFSSWWNINVPLNKLYNVLLNIVCCTQVLFTMINWWQETFENTIRLESECTRRIIQITKITAQISYNQLFPNLDVMKLFNMEISSIADISKQVVISVEAQIVWKCGWVEGGSGR